MERVMEFERGVVMRLHRTLLTVMLALGVAIPCVAQNVDQIQLETTQVDDSVFVISGGGGNIGVLTGPDGVLLIDTQMGQFEDKIRAAVAAVSDQPVRYIINTHWHFDHTGCNACFAKSQPVIIGPEGTRERMASAQDFPLLGIQSEASAETALPTISVTDTLNLTFNGEEIELTYFAGAHSGADLIVHLKHANIIHAGDLYWSQGYPYIGTPHGGSLEGLVEASNLTLEMANSDTKIIPGHGDVTDRAGLEAYRDLLVAVRDRIAELIADGLSVEEILASHPTADTDEGRKMGMPPELFVRIVYRDISQRGE